MRLNSLSSKPIRFIRLDGVFSDINCAVDALFVICIAM